MASPVLALPLGFAADEVPAQPAEIAQAGEPGLTAPAAASNNVRRRMLANAAPRIERRAERRAAPAQQERAPQTSRESAPPQEVSIACGRRGCVVTNGLEVTVVESSR